MARKSANDQKEAKRKEVKKVIDKLKESGYKIIETTYPFKDFPHILYDEDLQDAIESFEFSYGKIDGKIYYSFEKNLTGITGTQPEYFLLSRTRKRFEK